MNQYDLMFQRNIGIFTQAEQEKIKNLSVAIAGVGGVGGNVLMNLVRLGIQNFTIADPEPFDLSNINRQHGSGVEAIDKNKCAVLKNMITSINPDCSIRTFEEGLTEENVEEFIEGADVVVDELDFFCLRVRKKLIDLSLASNRYVFSSMILGFGATLLVFSPDGPSFEDYYGPIPEEITFDRLMAYGLKCFPYIPDYVNLQEYTNALDYKRSLPSLVMPCSLSGAMLATDLISYLIKNKKPVTIPEVKQIDLLEGKVVVTGTKTEEKLNI